MVSRKLLGQLESKSKVIANGNKKIWDIILYGSLARGKEKINDIDIVIVLKSNEKLSYKIDLAQAVKEALIIEDEKIELDMKCIDIDDLTNPNNLARQGIITEGFSLVRDVPLSDMFGFRSYGLFTYTLQGKTATEKRIFSYILSGRYGSNGIIKNLGIKIIGKGTIAVPIRHYEEIVDFLEGQKIKFKKEKCLIAEY